MWKSLTEMFEELKAAFVKKHGGADTPTPQQLIERARKHYELADPASKIDGLTPLRVHQTDFTSSYMLKLHNRANYIDARPEILSFTGKFVNAMRKRGFPLYVHTCYRSPELQASLRAKGFSKVSSGSHQRSAAVDIVHAHYHWLDRVDAKPAKQYWDLVGSVGKDIIRQNRYPITWGGDWSFYDPAHWELNYWQDLPEVEDTGEVVTYTPEYLRKTYK